MGRARRAVGDLRSAENYDAVILSELVYDEELHAELVATLGRALRPGAVAHSVFCDRPCSFNFFVQLAEALSSMLASHLDDAQSQTSGIRLSRQVTAA